jgi:phosphoglycerate dehydrogenase-like enzyme
MNVLLMYAPSATHLSALRAAAPGANFRVASDEPAAAELIEDADVVLGNRYFLQSLPHARRLRWMQSNSMGVDLILRAGALRGDVILTCARGVYDDEIAEHALALVLALARGLHHARDEQREHRWVRRPLRTLVGTRALVVGWGGVGRGIARRLAALGVRVEGVRRRSHDGPMADETGFVVRGPITWRHALPMTDHLILALPLTRETYHLVGADELAALPPGAFVVNVGRGGTLDDGALLEALRAGRLSGAGLDVLESEPPPADHRAWSEPSLLLTPHVARSMESPPFRWERLFVENLRRFSSGEPLLNVVDRDSGY